MTEEAAPTKKKRKKALSPTARTLAECRKRGWVAQVVEKWNSHAHVLQDLFGFIDIVALTPEGIVGIQATIGSHHANRVTKILTEPRARAWDAAGGKIQVWSWSKQGARNARKLWTLRVEDVTPMLEPRIASGGNKMVVDPSWPGMEDVA